MITFKKIRIFILVSILLIVAFFSISDPSVIRKAISPVLNSKPIRELAIKIKKTSVVPETTLVSNQSVQQLYEKTQLKYALRPDFRFIMAASEFKRLITGNPVKSIQYLFNKGKWVVYFDKQKIGELPEIPSFDQGVSFISEYADKVLLQSPIIVSTDPVKKRLTQPAGADGFYPQKLIHNIVQLDSLWRKGEYSDQLLFELTQNLVRLVFSSGDQLQFNDLLIARTIAALVLSRKKTVLNFDELESQLSYKLRYRLHAKKLSKNLPNDSLWKQFINKNEVSLTQQLKKDLSLTDARYYLLNLYAESRDYGKWIDHMNTYYRDKSTPIHAMITGYKLARFDTLKKISRSIPGLVVDSFSDKNDWVKQWDALKPYLSLVNLPVAITLDEIIKQLFQVDVKTQFNLFNQLLKADSENYSGPFLDSTAWRGYQKGYFISSIYNHGMFNLDNWNNLDATEQYANLLLDTGDEEAKKLATFFLLLVKAEKGGATVNELVEQMQLMSHYGPDPQLRIYKEIESKLEFGSPLVHQILTNIVNNIDSRIESRIDYANILRDKILYLSKAEQIYTSYIRDEGEYSVSIEAWLARYFGDNDKVLSLLDRNENSASVTANILGNITFSNLSNSDQDLIFQGILKRYPSDWDILSSYLEILEKRNENETAIKWIEKWLKKVDKNTSSFDYYQAIIALSRNYRQLDQPEKSRQVISTILDSYYGWAFYEATEVFIQLKEFDSALKIAEIARERYPNSTSSLMNLVKTYWNRSEYETAAGLLQKYQLNTSLEDWRWKIGEAFIETFKNNVDDGIKAATAILQMNIKQVKLGAMATEINKQGLPDIAFTIHDGINSNGLEGVSYKVYAYRSLETLKGKDFALDWLNKNVQPRLKNQSCMLLMENSLYHLLWDFIDDPDSGPYPQMVWLARAAAYIQNPEKDAILLKRLVEYYNNPAHDDYIDELGRIALDMKSGEDFLNQSASAKKIGEIAYYKAIQEYGRGNYNRAADWFLVSIETGYKRNGEYRWAYNSLYAWMTHNMSIKQYLKTNQLN